MLRYEAGENTAEDRARVKNGEYVKREARRGGSHVYVDEQWLARFDDLWYRALQIEGLGKDTA